MKKIILYSALVAFLVSCGNATDKNSELAKLKSQRDELNKKIEQLESEINPNGKADEAKPESVKISPVTECVFDHYIQVQGTVDGDQNIAVSPQLAGIVTAVYVKEGDHVKKGQVLADLDDKLTKQSLEEVNTQLELATSIFDKQSALWDKKIGSEVQYLQAKTNKEALEQKVATIKEQLKMSKVISPIDGTVELVPLRVGQMASPGVPTSTVRIINMRVAKITADVSETYATSIKNGDQALVSFPDLGKELATKLNFTSRYIDPTDRTFKVECKVSSSEFELRANMIAYIKIKDYTNDKAFCLPVNFVQTNQNGKFVFVAVQKGNDWVADRRTIKTGKDYDGTVEVLEGLSVGDKVITAGYQSLIEGEKVEF